MVRCAKQLLSVLDDTRDGREARDSSDVPAAVRDLIGAFEALQHGWARHVREAQVGMPMSLKLQDRTVVMQAVLLESPLLVLDVPLSPAPLDPSRRPLDSDPDKPDHDGRGDDPEAARLFLIRRFPSRGPLSEMDRFGSALHDANGASTSERQTAAADVSREWTSPPKLMPSPPTEMDAFFWDARARLAAMRGLFAGGDGAGLSLQAHALAESAGAAGARSVADAARALFDGRGSFRAAAAGLSSARWPVVVGVVGEGAVRRGAVERLEMQLDAAEAIWRSCRLLV